jgi:DNA polymerase I-like protein with 3'-5' exonuclease and polymerase domains
MKYHRLNRTQLLEVLARDNDDLWVMDTETDGLNVMGPIAEHGPYWIGLAKHKSENVFIIHIEEYLQWGLAQAFEKLRFVGHNIRFDLHGLNLKPKKTWRDTMVAAYYGHTSGKRSMDHLAQVNGWRSIPTPELLKKGKIKEIPDEELFEYLANDCIITSLMWSRYCGVDCEFEYEVERAVYEMECRGLAFIEENFIEVEVRVDELIREAKRKLLNAGFDGNLDSPVQVADWLLSTGRRLPLTAKGKPSTSKIALQQLADKGDVLAQQIIDYRKAIKLKTGFIVPLPRFVQDGILYPRTNTTSTRTGRFSCDSPNLQQIPKRGPIGKAIRQCLTSPGRNGVIACDFSQIELRVAAALAGETVLLEAFEQGRCPHTEVAAKILGKNVEAVTPDERFKAKAVNFGILNGMGSKRLAIELKSDKGTAARFLNDYKRNLHNLNRWMEEQWRLAEGYRVARTVAGRTRIFTSNEETRPAVSVIVQGSAAELMRRSLVAVSEAGLEPILSVHDEILIGDATEKRASELKEVMEYASNNAWPEVFGSVTFTAEAEMGETWGDA